MKSALLQLTTLTIHTPTSLGGRNFTAQPLEILLYLLSKVKFTLWNSSFWRNKEPQIAGFSAISFQTAFYRLSAISWKKAGFHGQSLTDWTFWTWKFYKCFFKNRGEILVFENCWISWVFGFYFQDVSSRKQDASCRAVIATSWLREIACVDVTWKY